MPPTIGLDANITLRNVNVNLNQVTGFLVRADTFRILLPKRWFVGTNIRTLIGTDVLTTGKRVIEFVVLCVTKPVARDGSVIDQTAQGFHNLIRAFAARVNESHTLVDPDGLTFTVGIEEMEDRLAPEGGQWLLRWETRVVCVET